MLANVAAGILIASTHGADDRLDFICPPTRASVVMKQLSARSGLDLQADSTVADDVLEVRVHAVRVAELMQKIAGAARATWTRRRDTFYLGHSIEAERQCQKALVEEYAVRLRKGLEEANNRPGIVDPWGPNNAAELARAIEEMAQQRGPDSPRYKGPDIRYRVPAARAIARLVARIGPHELAEHLTSYPTVYSTAPTPMQVGFSGADDILAEYLAEQTAYVAASPPRLPMRRPRGQNRFMTNGMQGAFEPGSDPLRGIGKASIRISGEYSVPSLNADMVITDGGGHPLGHFHEWYMLEPRAVRPFAVSDKESVVPAEPLAVELRRAGGQLNPGSNDVMNIGMTTMVNNKAISISMQTPKAVSSRPLSDPLLKFLRDPLANEPLRLTVGSVLDKAAQARGDNLVADLDDRTYPVGDGDGKRPSEWLASTQLQNYEEVDETAGWLMLALRDPIGARTGRVSRAGLGAIDRAFLKARFATTDDWARLAQMQDAAPVGFDSLYLEAAGATPQDLNTVRTSWPAYRWLGALTPDQSGDLRSGKPVELRSLSGSAAEALRRLVYEADLPPKLTDRAGKPLDGASGPLTDWTEILPDGVPGDGIVAEEVSSVPAAYCVNSKTNTVEIRSAAQFAAARFAETTPQFNEFASRARFDGYAPARLVTRKLAFRLTPMISIEASVSGPELDEPVTLTSYEELSAGFRDQIEQTFTDYKAAFSNAKVFWRQAGPPGSPPP